MRLIAYLRVSSESQLEGYGLASQEAAVRAWSKRHGHIIVTVLSDRGVSGARDALDRPALGEALQLLKQQQAAGLVVARLDRLARALTVQEATLGIVWRTGTTVFTADQGEVLRDDPDDPMRSALRQVVGVFSELERRLVSKRLRDGRAAKASTGRKAVGSYAYGFCAGGVGRARDAVADPAEAAVVNEVLSQRASGASYRNIADALNVRQVPSKRGGAWHPMTVRNIVERVARGT